MRLVVAVASMLIATSACAGDCDVAFGAAIDFARCPVAHLPGVDVTFVRTSSPAPELHLSCREYEARREGAEPAKFQQCSTGVLGGQAIVHAGDLDLTVLFDVPTGCKRWPAGNWGPGEPLMRVHEGVLDADAIAAVWKAQSDEEAACRARNRK